MLTSTEHTTAHKTQHYYFLKSTQIEWVQICWSLFPPHNVYLCHTFSFANFFLKSFLAFLFWKDSLSKLQHECEDASSNFQWSSGNKLRYDFEKYHQSNIILELGKQEASCFFGETFIAKPENDEMLASVKRGSCIWVLGGKGPNVCIKLVIIFWLTTAHKTFVPFPLDFFFY